MKVKETRQHLGTIGVDSGQMMLVDPCYIGENWDPNYHQETVDEFIENETYPLSYNGACAGSRHMAGNLLERGIGAVCSTGFGDGSYDVYITWGNFGEWGQRVIKMEVIFIPDDEI